MRAQVISERGTGGPLKTINGEVLLEHPHVAVVITDDCTHHIPWARVIDIVEAHPTNEQDNRL
ncbi:hypothetical protein [Williamsia soli]|uniref:hypothetical protein n=1 Tax=Williamsia soli TaxID=364929 RepID=UPI001A9EAA5A|nr:hypothetical protein [Williamsia soli]